MYTNSYITYRALLQLSSEADLFEMIESENPAWRYYGFLGIAERQEGNVFEGLKKVIQDTTLVRGHFGCVVSQKTLADFCINEVTKVYRHGNYEFDTYQLTNQEKQALDSLVLSSDLNLKYKKYITTKKQ